MGQPNQDICTIRIMFPVESDEQAIDCKKKIKAVLADISNVNLQFGLTDMASAAALTPR